MTTTNTPNPRTIELHQLMDTHRLKAREVGELLGRSASTVRIWRVDGGARAIPAQALELLRLKLQARVQ